MITQDPKAGRRPVGALILSWRDEIAAELEEAKKAIPPLQAAHEAAAATVRQATGYYQDAVRILLKPVYKENGTRYEAAETAVNLRLEVLRMEADQAKSRLARAKADIEAVRRKTKDLQAALNQIDRAIPPAEEEAA